MLVNIKALVDMQPGKGSSGQIILSLTKTVHFNKKTQRKHKCKSTVLLRLVYNNSTSKHQKTVT